MNKKKLLRSIISSILIITFIVPISLGLSSFESEAADKVINDSENGIIIINGSGYAFGGYNYNIGGLVTELDFTNTGWDYKKDFNTYSGDLSISDGTLHRDGFSFVPKQINLNGDSLILWRADNSEGSKSPIKSLKYSYVKRLSKEDSLIINSAKSTGNAVFNYGQANLKGKVDWDGSSYLGLDIYNYLTDETSEGTASAAEFILFIYGLNSADAIRLPSETSAESYLDITTLVSGLERSEVSDIVPTFEGRPILNNSPIALYLKNIVGTSPNPFDYVPTNSDPIGFHIINSLVSKCIEKDNTLKEQDQGADSRPSTGEPSLSEAIEYDGEDTNVNKWMFAINKYFVDAAFEGANYDASTSFTFPGDYVVDISLFNPIKNESFNTEFTPEEDLRLRIYYNIMRQYYIIKEPSSAYNTNLSILDNNFKLKGRYSTDGALRNQGDDSINLPYVPAVIECGSEDLGADSTWQTRAAASVDKMSNADNLKISSRSVAINFNSVVDYLMYGIIKDNAHYAITEEESASAEIKWSEGIDNIVPSIQYDMTTQGLDTESSITTVGLDYTDYYVPKIEVIKEIQNNQQGVVHMARLYASMKYIKRYASITKTLNEDVAEVSKDATSTAGLTVITNQDTVEYNSLTENDFTNLEVETFLTEREEKGAEVNPDAKQAEYIRAIIEITEGLKTIGMIDDSLAPKGDGERWLSPELKCIISYYDRVKEFKDEQEIANVANSTEGEATTVFKMFFGDEYDGYTADYIKGVAVSATYVPLLTNTYEVESLGNLLDSSFIEGFHYKYGFHRKALFIDSKTDAASRAYITGQKDVSRVATLRDFLNADQDIVLYLDPNMYNVDQVAEAQNLAYNKLQNTDEAGKAEEGLLPSIADSWAEWRGYSAEAICKTGESKVYSQKLINSGKIKQYGTIGDNSWFSNEHRFNHYVLSDNSIDEYLQETDDYNPNIAFAVVSGVYRDSKAFNIAYNQSSKMPPVFVSSPDMWNLKGINSDQFNSLYNYMMASNIQRKLGTDPDVEDDLDSPLFMDIYGNITTQSGLVVIPAAANATLYKSGEFNPTTAAMADLYGDYNATRVKATNKSNLSFLDDKAFIVDDDGEIQIGNPIISGVSMNFTNLNVSAAAIKKKLYNRAVEAVSEGMGTTGEEMYNMRFNLILEVMRGAPVENIDYQKEGLSGTRNMDRTGIYMAYRVEQLTDVMSANSNGNNLLSIPNVAFLPYIEYVIVFIFSILFAAGMFILSFKIYQDGSAGMIGWRTVLSFITTMVCIIGSIIAVPSLLNFSYYQTNKALLQDEAFYIQMINYEKKLLGTEVGVRENKTPTSTTKLYLKLDQVSVPYWNLATDVFAENKFQSMSEIYDKAMSSSVYYGFDGAVRKNNALYVDVDYLYESSAIQFASPETISIPGGKTESEDGSGYTGAIYQNRILDEQQMSYVIPYYAIMDSLIYDINTYNSINESSAYRIKQNKYGLSTMGMCKSYLLSNEFIGDSEDRLGLYEIYGIERGLMRTFFTESEIQAMRNAYWCNWEGYTDEEIKEKLVELDNRVVKFVVQNRNMLDKVSDETFIKTMCLYASVQHNELFKVPTCSGVEVIELDMNDLLRLAVAERSKVTSTITLSYANFVYQTGGVFAIVLIVFVQVIIWFTSLLKPIVMIVFLGLLIYSFIFKRMMKHESNQSLQGYLVSMALMCLVNGIYALLLKLMLMGPELGFNTFSCIVFILFVQILYVIVLLSIMRVVLQNHTDIGMYGYRSAYDKHFARRIDATRMRVSEVTSGRFGFSSRRPTRSKYSRYTSTRGLTGDDIVRDMRYKEELRRDRAYGRTSRRQRYDQYVDSDR